MYFLRAIPESNARTFTGVTLNKHQMFLSLKLQQRCQRMSSAGPLTALLQKKQISKKPEKRRKKRGKKRGKERGRKREGRLLLEATLLEEENWLYQTPRSWFEKQNTCGGYREGHVSQPVLLLVGARREGEKMQTYITNVERLCKAML